MDGLKPELLTKIFTMENIPTTLKDVTKAAAKFEGNWKRAKAITRSAQETHKKTSTPAPKVERSTLDTMKPMW
jgi:hypothetical protein